MHRFRALLLALLALALIPATASADLRSPALGEASLLSDTPASRTWAPAIATDGNTTFVVYLEERQGVSVNRISATGTEIGGSHGLQGPGTVSVEDPKIAVDGDDVYVGWIQGSFWQSERHAVVAASHDGGRTFAPPVRAGRPTGHGAWDLELAADGDNVFVAYTDNTSRIWTAGSRDGAKTFPCFAQVNEPGDRSSDFSLALDGDHVYWTWLSSGADVYVRRSVDGGRSIEPMQAVHDGNWTLHPGSPTIAAGDGTVAVAISKRSSWDREDGSGKDFGAEPLVLTSGDGGASWGEHVLTGARCVGDYCSAPYGLDVDDDRVYVTWRAQGNMYIAQSTNGGAGFGGPQVLGPYLYTWHTQSHPYVDAHGDSVVAVWHSAPNPDGFDLDPVAAFSSDHGQTFQLRTVDASPGKDLLPVAAAWGPDPQGAGFAWWKWGETWTHHDPNVLFAPMSAAAPDVELVSVRPHQAAQDAARLAAGRPTTVRAMVRSLGAERTSARAKVELSYDDEDGRRVERTLEEDVVLRPGLNPVQLLARDPIEVGAGRVTAKVTLNARSADTNPDNNTGEGSKAVVQPRALKVLFVPVAADDEAFPACRDVQDVAEGAERFIEAGWPVDPDKFTVVSDCSSRLVHAPPLTEPTLMGPGQLMHRLDRLKWNDPEIDKVIGVVPQGWFSRQQIEGFQQAVGIAPNGGGFDAGLVERQNTGGWIVAHELAHSYGWTEDETTKHHLNDEPAPGFWVAERRDVAASTRDFMHFNTNGGDIASPTGRWTSKATWDFLTEELSTGEILGVAAAGDVLSLTGSVAPTGDVQVGPAVLGEGTPDATTPQGEYTFELLGQGGAVVGTTRFDAVDELGPIGNATATKDTHIKTATAAFSLQVPAPETARSLRVRRGEDVLVTRTRSANAPTLTVATPARVELGETLKVTWDADDADGDTLTSQVSISTDGGASWRSLGDATTAEELAVKAIVTIGGQDVRVRVTTTDGWNTATAESGSFVVGGQLTDGLVVAEDWFGGVVTANLDGSDLKRISTTGNEPRWSPDGRKLAWRHDEVFVADADGSGVRQLTNAGATGDFLLPVWMPDGDKLIAMRRTNMSNDGNTVIDAETGAEQGRFGARYGQLCGFTRDGSRALVRWNSTPAYELYRADGTQGAYLKQTITGKDCLAMSPDGRYGVVTRYPEKGPSILDVIVYDLQTGAERNLTNGQFGGYNAYPTWSPTGEWIVWASNRDRGGSTGFGSTDIWKIRPDGTGAQKIMDAKPGNKSFEEPDVQPLRGTAPDPEPTLEQRDPNAAVAALSGSEGLELVLDASASTPGAEDAPITAYAWDLDGDGVYTDAAGAKPKTTFPDEGTYPVSVLVTDAKGRTATASADVKVANAAPEILQAKLGDGEPANLSARIADSGSVDELEAKVFWNGSATGETVPLIATGDGYTLAASRTGGAATARVEVVDGDGGSDAAEARRVVAPANGAPAAADATATVVAGESVDIPLPATDPEEERLAYEIVDQPARGSLQLREPSVEPSAPDVTYTATDVIGPVTFSYRVSDGASRSGVATVTVNVTARPDEPVVEPKPLDPEVPEPPRVSRTGTRPLDPRTVEAITRAAADTTLKAADVFTLPSSKGCVSRRHFRIRVAKGDYTQVAVWVNGKAVKTLRGKRITAAVDLRGLPKGRFTVKIAATLKTGKVVKQSRTFRTCTPKAKKGARR